MLYQVLADKGYDGTTTDVWSCGVILFVLMAGYLPFDEPNLNALYRKVISGSFLLLEMFLGLFLLYFQNSISIILFVNCCQILKASFSLPPWLSSSSKNLIKRILDPNPLTVSPFIFALFTF